MIRSDIFESSTALWWKIMCKASDYRTIAQYRASIPPILDRLVEIKQRHQGFDHVMLDDPRLPLEARAKLMGVSYTLRDNGTFIPIDDRHATPVEPYWIVSNDGRPDDRPPNAIIARQATSREPLFATADVLLCYFLHHPEAFARSDYTARGLGSTRDTSRACYANLMLDSYYGHSLYAASEEEEDGPGDWDTIPKFIRSSTIEFFR